MTLFTLLREERVRGRMRNFREALSKRRKQREVDEKMGLTRQSRLEEFFPATRRRKVRYQFRSIVNRLVA